MAREDQGSLYHLARECDKSFNRYISSAGASVPTDNYHEHGRPVLRLMKEYQARFHAWSSYMGVFAEERVSLDRRLENTPDIRNSVFKLLQVLNGNLDSLSQILATSNASRLSRNQPSRNLRSRNRTLRNRPLRDQSPKRSPSPDSSFSLRSQQHQGFIEGAIDRLHRLGVTIRRSSTASLLSRVKAFSARRANPPLEELYSQAVKCLYPLASDSLQNHVTQSMLERHFTLLYREERQKRLARRRTFLDESNEELKQEFPAEVSHPAAEILIATATPGRLRDTPRSGGDAKESKTSQNVSIPETKPSTLKTDEFRKKLQFDEVAAGNPISSPVSSAPAGNIRYPKPPKAKEAGQPVICTWCFEPLFDAEYEKGHEQHSRWWRRHVDHDLKPYVCLAETCSKPALTFDKMSLWRAHMRDMHSPKWAREIHREPMWNCDIDHQPAWELDSSTALEKHMHHAHGESFSPGQIATILRQSSGYRTREDGVCPFRCSYTANEDPTIKQASADLEQACKNSLPKEILPPSRKRRNSPKKIGPKRRRLVRFVEEISHDSEELSDHESEVLDNPEQDDSRYRRDEMLQKALSRHIAMHLTTLAFLTLRFKELQENEETQDDDASTSLLPSHETSDDESNVLNSDLDDISLTFDEDPLRPDIHADSILLDEDQLGLPHMTSSSQSTQQQQQAAQRQDEDPFAPGLDSGLEDNYAIVIANLGFVGVWAYPATQPAKDLGEELENFSGEWFSMSEGQYDGIMSWRYELSGSEVGPESRVGLTSTACATCGPGLWNITVAHNQRTVTAGRDDVG